jgi:hypothetical protein
MAQNLWGSIETEFVFSIHLKHNFCSRCFEGNRLSNAKFRPAFISFLTPEVVKHEGIIENTQAFFTKPRITTSDFGLLMTCI